MLNIFLAETVRFISSVPAICASDSRDIEVVDLWKLEFRPWNSRSCIWISRSLSSNPSSADERINELEQSINELRTEMGADGGSPSPLSASKKPDADSKPEEASTE
ncbi:hypothetical protein L2E82_13228 [Cichorium intybus]|uniref:Uncharacterized protein n=1 Tax=Cichorium intybus TaxID=13427 RepID=A0ACB9GI10_CICIN|nr:hypothetical protein L2E82_13228 [Cichorium intybus]